MPRIPIFVCWGGGWEKGVCVFLTQVHPTPDAAPVLSRLRDK